MKRKRLFFRRLGAGALAAGILWAVGVTAGSDTAQSAWASLRAASPMVPLRWELADWWPADALSPAVTLALAQAPLLLSARAEVAELWKRGEEPASEDEEEGTVILPSDETPAQTQPLPEKDNGVPAKTLLPTDLSGYTVCGLTCISNSTDHVLSIPALTEPFDAALSPEEPQILILHTHGSEAYTPPAGTDIVWSGDHRTTDSRYNVVKVGDEMAAEFAEAGLSVLHDRTLYDYPNYAGSYDRSLAAIQSYLAQYPSIQFVLDVHRDAIGDSQGNQYKVISQVEEGTAAQLSLVVGSDGSGAPHERWMENLKLAVAIQQNILQDNPSLMRPLLLRNSRYNQHATTGSLLVEVGAAGNSPEEAALAGRIFARQMAQLLEDKSK